METNQSLNKEEHGNKINVSFKCNPSLKSSLCKKAELLGISLSSHLETILQTGQYSEKPLAEKDEKIKKLEERILYYEQHAKIKNLYKNHKGQTLSYMDSENRNINLKIDSEKDVLTLIINSFNNKK
ncbi:MAG TPA: hypothetical protein VNG53_02440 [Bacteroidia bacterium]|nr:hypothetical protein [Bacteroidia bacterium]